MEKSNGLHLMYKNLGETPNETILRFKEENPDYKDVTMTYAGRLDPMAEGLLLVLSGEKLHSKEEYLNLPKTYEFSILWGASTDTLDILGLPLKQSDSVPEEIVIKEEIQKFVGEFVQKYPVYSSKPVSGKPLFKWAREGRLSQIEIPTHKVSLNKIIFNGRGVIKEKNLLEKIKERISKVSGDFRQKEILNKWESTLVSDREFFIDSFTTEVSSGFYVRQFVSDLAERLQTKGLTFHIKRISIGEFRLK